MVEKTIEAFFAKYLKDDTVEIEAKLGLIMDSDTGYRFKVLGGNDPVLVDRFDYRIKFESNIPESSFKNCNLTLNKIASDLYEKSRAPDYAGVRMKYVHLKERDSFAPDRVRITRDTKSNEFLRAVRKNRIEDLNIHLPGLNFDVRLSASSEVPCEVTRAEQMAIPSEYREKDRMSYTIEPGQWSFDLTQVKTVRGPVRETAYELEVELISKQNDPQTITRSLLNNVRQIITFCNMRPPPPPPPSSSHHAQPSQKPSTSTPATASVTGQKHAREEDTGTQAEGNPAKRLVPSQD